MIAFIDIAKKSITIHHDKGFSTIPISNVQEIDRIIGNSKVLYVKDAAWVDKNQILRLLGKNPGHNIQKNTPQVVKDGTLWVHWTGKGTLHISDFGIKERAGRSAKEEEYVGYYFRGPADFHELNKLKSLGCEKSEQFNNLLKSTGKDKLEIVDGDFKKNFLKTYKSDTQARKDKYSDSILVGGKAADYASKIRSGEISKSSAIEININESNLRSAGANDNEGSLVPDDVE